MHVGASTQPEGTLDEGTFKQRYGETVQHRATLRESCSLFVARAMVRGAAQCGAVERLRPQECSDCAAQERVHELNVDVLVALDGWTQGNKNKMLA